MTLRVDVHVNYDPDRGFIATWSGHKLATLSLAAIRQHVSSTAPGGTEILFHWDHLSSNSKHFGELASLLITGCIAQPTPTKSPVT
jgi:hypothetical protein